MKRIIAILLVLSMLLALAGCNIKKKLSEKLAEQILEGNSGADVDIDGDSMTVEGEDGTTTTIGATKWPTSDFAKNIPEFKDGNITWVMESTNYLYIMLDTVEQKDATKYLESIKADYNVEPSDMTYDGGFTYSAKNADGIPVWISFSDGSMVITIGESA